jgi:probable F420-dependent oxidoreductase
VEGRRAFRFGVNSVTTSAREWQEVARKAEALGYSTLIAQDHFGQQLAPLPALVAAGAVTTTLRLATLVLDNDFRHPAAMAKEAATVDVLTGGRLELGLGAGWLEADYIKTGLPFDPPAVRFERLTEAVQIVKALFSDADSVSFKGKHYQIEGLDVAPRPVQRPRPPIMVGGRQRRMLTFAAREADIVGISLLGNQGPSFEQKTAWAREAAAERDVEFHINASVVAITDDPAGAIAAAAERSGRFPEDVRASPATLVGSVDAIVERLEAHRARYGVTYYVVAGRTLDAFAPVVKRLAT